MSPVVNPWIAALTGQSVGDYRILSCIGQGSFGVVFEAEHGVSGEKFAVKVLTQISDLDALTDFENEGDLLKSLNTCDGTVNYIDGGISSFDLAGPGGMVIPIDLRFHVMTLADGNLEELLLDPASRSDLGWEERIAIWRSVTLGVMQMHQRNVVHRDLKSSNCLLAVRDRATRVKIADFGRARNLSAPPTRAAVHYQRGRGDFRFAAPEALYWQGGSEPDDFLAADYYGLGSVLVELVSGQSMTSLAIGDYRTALLEGQADYTAGVRRDLAALNLQYLHVIDELVATMPSSVRADARNVLTSLCHPEPQMRAKVSYRRDRLSREPLAWVLRRADIMTRRLSIERRQNQRLGKGIAK